MTRDEFLTRLEELYDCNIEISRAKNADYTGDDNDPFKNFRASALYGVSVEKGILVRMADKMARTASLLDNDAQVKDESILDTLSDLANYAMILRIWIENQSVNRASSNLLPRSNVDIIEQGLGAVAGRFYTP